jgi:5-(carboxyamino)imidazole ribonucleotide synthase
VATQRLRVGVLGGGQLARMMALAGIPLGLEFVFLDPAADACAASTGKLLQADFSNIEAARRLAAMVDVATFDFENVPDSSALAVAESRPFYPNARALGLCQDRLQEKKLLSGLGIPVSAWHAVSSRTDLLDGLDRVGRPAVLKTRRFGYDGKGQAVIRDDEDLERSWQRLGDNELILEAFVPFDAECSLIAARGRDGETRTWPLTQNLHREGILALSLPGAFDDALQRQAEKIMRQVMDDFAYVGVLTLEFFVTGDTLLVNEIAPRVHNSGHWTIEGAGTSQFENHVRAICGLPLGETGLSRHALMFNWIGSLPDARAVLDVSGVHWHDYGKAPRPGRKLGHATVTADSQAALAERARQVASIVGGDFPALLQELAG